MKLQIKTAIEVQAFIANANKILGYPDGRGTDTYCNFPELVEIKQDDVVIDSYYEIEVTGELNAAMIKIATDKLIGHEDTTEN